MKLPVLFAAALLLGAATAQAQTVLPSGAVAPAGTVMPSTGEVITPGTVPGAQPVIGPGRGGAGSDRARRRADKIPGLDHQERKELRKLRKVRALPTEDGKIKKQ